jgi:hypothetical protein
MQNGAPDLKQVSGPQLHTEAVVSGLRKQGHLVRMVANQDHRLGWSEDLQNWFPSQCGPIYNRIFRLFESMLRRDTGRAKVAFPIIGKAEMRCSQ